MRRLLSLIIPILFFISCDRQSLDLIPVLTDEGTYMYIDLDGKIVINPQFTEAGAFIDGLALVKAESSGGSGAVADSVNYDSEEESVAMYGFIKEDGSYLIPPSLVRATVFSEKKAWVVKENGAPEVIDTEGNVLFTLKDAENVTIFSNGLAGFSTVNKEGIELWGYVNDEGEVVINPQFYEIGKCGSDLCPVKNKSGKWGYINLEGNIVVNYQFRAADTFVNDVAPVQLGNKVGLIDRDGKIIINPQFSEIIVDNDKLLVKSGDLYGWTDLEGKFLINPQFDEAIPFYESNLAPVQSGDSWGYIDEEGKYLINPQFEYAFPFYNGKAIVRASDLFGVITEDGKYAVNPQFENLPRDLYFILVSNFKVTEFARVQTDYFNIDALLSTINFSQPEGLNTDSNFRAVAEKFGLSEKNFQSYQESKYLINNQKITNDISYDFIVLGKPFDVEDGWYYTYRYNPNIRVSGFEYRVSLRGKGYGKQESVLKALVGKLNGYDLVYQNDNESIYSNNDRHVIFNLYYGDIRVAIIPGPHYDYGDIYEGPMDSSAVDSAAN